MDKRDLRHVGKHSIMVQRSMMKKQTKAMYRNSEFFSALGGGAVLVASFILWFYVAGPLLR